MKEPIQKREVTRRDFLQKQLSLAATVSVAPHLLRFEADKRVREQGKPGDVSTREALYYENVV